MPEASAHEQYNLGLRYAKGEGVPRDFQEAARWFRLAADQGHCGAQCYLGAMHAFGHGVPLDRDEGVRLIRVAADQGYADAQSNSGQPDAGRKRQGRLSAFPYAAGSMSFGTISSSLATRVETSVTVSFSLDCSR